MRGRLPIFFIILYGFGLLRPLAPLIDFELNKGYIQDFLCINRDKPVTVCGGKCYLTKQLKKAIDFESKSATVPSINLADYPIGFVYLYRLQTQLSGMEIIRIGMYSFIYSFQFIHTPFHPPEKVMFT
ncbi:MAG: hypothetical protein AAGF85_10605 [Bacteroidota bacterium]